MIGFNKITSIKRLIKNTTKLIFTGARKSKIEQNSILTYFQIHQTSQ
jgi:hypothetical protein